MNKKVLNTLPTATPIIEEFIERMENVKPVSREKYLRSKALYEIVNRNFRGNGVNR